MLQIIRAYRDFLKKSTQILFNLYLKQLDIFHKCSSRIQTQIIEPHIQLLIKELKHPFKCIVK